VVPGNAERIEGRSAGVLRQRRPIANPSIPFRSTIRVTPPVDRIQTFRTTQRERRPALHPLFTFIAAASVPSRPKEGFMNKVELLFYAGVLTSIRGAAPMKQDQAKGTAVKRARGNF
jgi:hypothetical protein